jgi:tetratricopeptide (TPR) repeat protein
LRGDTAAATATINDILDKDGSPSNSAFAAEFFYDYGNPIRAAEIFKEFPDDRSLVRQADALYLSGNIPNARNIWILLTASKQSEIKAKSLYNLAVTETNPSKIRSYLEQIPASLENAEEGKKSDYAVYGTIRYARLLPAEDALKLLETKQQDVVAPFEAARKSEIAVLIKEFGSKETKNKRIAQIQGEIAVIRAEQYEDPLLALEILRREREIETPEKSIAKSWLLLNKFPKDERMYQWAIWLFDFQRRYGETDMLIKNASFNNITGSWLDLHKGIALIRNDNLDGALKQFKAIADLTLWTVPANMARILEARHSAEEALEYYKAAASFEKKPENTARIQYRISRCLHILGRDAESKTALETAIRLKPDYLIAIEELKRLNSL